MIFLLTTVPVPSLSRNTEFHFAQQAVLNREVCNSSPWPAAGECVSKICDVKPWTVKLMPSVSPPA
jgi:hypothetical protein